MSPRHPYWARSLLVVGASTATLLLTTALSEQGCGTTYYADKDADSYGDPNDSTGGGATPPVGYVSDNTDCNDLDASIHAGASELPYDGLDQDCDGKDLVDVDGDGLASTAVGGPDCNDNDATAFSGYRSQEAGLTLSYACNGTYLQGSPENEVGRADNEQQHAVTLTHAFKVSTTLVTQTQFQTLMGYNSSGYKSCGGSCPVENVSWSEAAAFANALSASVGLPACYTCSGTGASVTCTAPANPYACKGYRLPTEAEWEYTARAGSTAAFSNGGNLAEANVSSCTGGVPLYDASQQLIGLLTDFAWYCGNTSPAQTRPVAQLKDNSWGLYDVSGNVYEWTHDFYDDYPVSAVTDPVGGTSGGTRIIRGGSFLDEPQYVRVAYRSDFNPANRADIIGFRVVRSVSP